jgi:hypothetical protein
MCHLIAEYHQTYVSTGSKGGVIGEHLVDLSTLLLVTSPAVGYVFLFAMEGALVAMNASFHISEGKLHHLVGI